MAELVSIIMPCYRQGRYLAAAINSALGQSYPNIEIIAVDDGSDDDTGDVARSFGDKIRYIRQKNGGPASARNNGLSVAKGKYILFLDSDDMLHKEAVTWLVEEAAGREDVMCVMGVQFFEREDDLTSGRIDMPPADRAAMAKKLLLICLNPPIAFLCSRSMVQKVGGLDPSPSVNACEDWELWIKLYFAGAELRPLYRVGAHYRRHPNSHSGNKIRNWYSGTEVMRRSVAYLHANPKRVESDGLTNAGMLRDMRHKLALDYRDLAYALREKGEYRRSFQCYMRSLKQGHLNKAALGGIIKLPLHMMFKGLFPRADAPSPAAQPLEAVAAMDGGKGNA